MITRNDLLKNKPLIMAGPCAVESKEQITTIAEALAPMGVHVLRSQFWKPRTSAADFQGVGEAGFTWVREIKEKTGLLVATEIVDKDHIPLTRGTSDILWVGARNMQNFELLKALAKDDRPVILKRGFINTMKEWLASADYIGRERVILCERGVRTGADSMRFTLDINSALVAKHDHGMPIIIDPSHTTGRRDMVPAMTLAGVAAGLDGIVVEVHNDPENALSDSKQQITLEIFKDLLDKVRKVYAIATGIA